jgi:uncharacterized membrane protein
MGWVRAPRWRRGFGWLSFGPRRGPLAFLGAVAASRARKRYRLLGTLAAVALVTAFQAGALWRLFRRRRLPAFVAGDGVTRLRRVITVNRPPHEVFRFWRRLENLPAFLAHVESIQVLDGQRSRWRARGPLGKRFEWTAEIVDEKPGELLAWRSLPASDVVTAGEVQFIPAPGGQGTEIHVALQYAPAGRFSSIMGRLFGKVVGEHLTNDLRRFKQAIEVGEVVRSDASASMGLHPARPSA